MFVDHLPANYLCPSLVWQIGPTGKPFLHCSDGADGETFSQSDRRGTFLKVRKCFPVAAVGSAFLGKCFPAGAARPAPKTAIEKYCTKTES